MAALQTSFQNVTSLQVSIRTEGSLISFLLQEFPSLALSIDLLNTNYNSKGTFHYVETGHHPPVCAKPHRHFPDFKLKVAKAEFDIHLKTGII